MAGEFDPSGLFEMGRQIQTIDQSNRQLAQNQQEHEMRSRQLDMQEKQLGSQLEMNRIAAMRAGIAIEKDGSARDMTPAEIANRDAAQQGLAVSPGVNTWEALGMVPKGASADEALRVIQSSIRKPSYRHAVTGEEFVPTEKGFIPKSQRELNQRVEAARAKQIEEGGETVTVPGLVDPETGQPMQVPLRYAAAFTRSGGWVSPGAQERTALQIGDLEAKATALQEELDTLSKPALTSDGKPVSSALDAILNKGRAEKIAGLQAKLTEARGKIAARRKTTAPPASARPSVDEAEFPKGTKKQKNQDTGEIRYVLPDGSVVNAR